MIEVVGWDPARKADFDRLNRWWLERWFTVEPLDEVQLGDPEGTILAKGGAVFFALDGGRSVGCVAAIPDAHGVQLAKLGVDEAVQRSGIGRMLCERVLAFAAARGAPCHLVTARRLTAAVRLYRRLGFAERPMPFPPPFDEPDLLYMDHRAPGVRIVPFVARHAPDVARLSREWIERDFVSKPEDAAYYADPAAQVIARGGAIWVAVEGDHVLGTVAALPDASGAVELCKLSVTAAAQGRGLGRWLCETVLAWAEARRAASVWLHTNHRLRPAIALYGSLGFAPAAPPLPAPHVDADVFMRRPRGPGPG